ncbi:Glyoxalase/Bleomycin resistance protein/Dihydroxybiphenyl dioxygenase [Flammula alnicola]|nr:Glyoxalase/Bleomycin resistance protein/Dihydroxybiphenyl dioxygenase [Flammula alnicola]
MPLHHIGINVANIEQARDFYLAALKPLGYKVKMTFADGQVLGLGAGCGGADLWLAGPNAPSAEGSEKRHAREPQDEPGKESTSMKQRQKTGTLHLAFGASNRAQVRKFYEAAIAAGATCNGPPGLRPEYFATYYGAFVLDPEGRNIEAVCMKPGFLAEEWGLVGCGAAALVVSAIGYGVAHCASWV